MFKKIISSVLIVLVLAMAPSAYAGKVELTTYYPAPYGEYKELKSTEGAKLATTSGNVGIGTANPQTKLHIDSGGTSGTPIPAVRIVDGNQAIGKALISDANGVGTWQTGIAGYNLDDVDVYTKSVGLGWTTLVDVSGSGVLLGGSVTGHLVSQIEITVDGTIVKTINPALCEIESGTDDDFASASLPGPIRFTTSLRIRFNDGASAGTITSGVAYVVQ
jgi:hypothetical protein